MHILLLSLDHWATFFSHDAECVIENAPVEHCCVLTIPFAMLVLLSWWHMSASNVLLPLSCNVLAKQTIQFDPIQPGINRTEIHAMNVNSINANCEESRKNMRTQQYLKRRWRYGLVTCENTKNKEREKSPHPLFFDSWSQRGKKRRDKLVKFSFQL